MKEPLDKLVLAGGCFWCTEAVFSRIKGVSKAVSGYTGGNIKNPAYREICTGRTGHAEAIEITYNPQIVCMEELLEIFFATHDPTSLNRQGNDVGTQYRSAIFYASSEQQNKAEAFIALLEKNTVFSAPIVTQVEPLGVFYMAEEDHQAYYESNSDQSYCQFIINPKIEKIKKYYSEKLKVR